MRRDAIESCMQLSNLVKLLKLFYLRSKANIFA